MFLSFRYLHFRKQKKCLFPFIYVKELLEFQKDVLKVTNKSSRNLNITVYFVKSVACLKIRGSPASAPKISTLRHVMIRLNVFRITLRFVLF